MTSVRLGPDLEQQLLRAAQAAGQTPSEFIRAAVQARVDLMWADSARERLTPYVGAAASGGGSDARHSGRTFARLLATGRA